MKLGKKLETTPAQKAVLLESGEVFYTTHGTKLSYDADGNTPFRADNPNCVSYMSDLWFSDWYYPAKTYTINGVELVDERVKVESAHDYIGKGYYVSSVYQEEGWHETTDLRPTLNEYLCSISLVHKTKEAAILHTKAMIKVAE